jgi:hypothetical protein
MNHLIIPVGVLFIMLISSILAILLKKSESFGYYTINGLSFQFGSNYVFICSFFVPKITFFHKNLKQFWYYRDSFDPARVFIINKLVRFTIHGFQLVVIEFNIPDTWYSQIAESKMIDFNGEE